MDSWQKEEQKFESWILMKHWYSFVLNTCSSEFPCKTAIQEVCWSAYTGEWKGFYNEEKNGVWCKARIC